MAIKIKRITTRQDVVTTKTKLDIYFYILI